MKNVFFIFCLVTSTHLFAQEPLKDSSFFLPQEYFQKMGLKKIQSNHQLKVYTNKDVDASISRLVDIRWVFNTAADAKKYFSDNLQLQSEDGFEYKKQIKLPGASIVKIYREEKGSAAMYEMFGSQHVHWYFIFVIDRVMVKVFTSGKATPFAETYSVAWDAAQDISKKLNQPSTSFIKADLNQHADSLFLRKVQDEKLSFMYPPGYESSKLPASLQTYFDQELSFPSEELVLRYYIVPAKSTVGQSDSLSYEKYTKDKYYGYLSISLNIMMGKLGEMPKTKELKDSVKCKKMFNGDYMLSSLFEVSKKSELAKGYSYCHMYAMYRKGYADCYVFYLSNNPESLALFPQLRYATLKFLDR